MFYCHHPQPNTREAYTPGPLSTSWCVGFYPGSSGVSHVTYPRKIALCFHSEGHPMIAASTAVQIIPPTRFTRHLSTGTSRIYDKRQCRPEDSPTLKVRYG